MLCVTYKQCWPVVPKSPAPGPTQVTALLVIQPCRETHAGQKLDLPVGVSFEARSGPQQSISGKFSAEFRPRSESGSRA